MLLDQAKCDAWWGCFRGVSSKPLSLSRLFGPKSWKTTSVHLLKGISLLCLLSNTRIVLTSTSTLTAATIV